MGWRSQVLAPPSGGLRPFQPYESEKDSFEERQRVEREREEEDGGPPKRTYVEEEVASYSMGETGTM
jgi:hypothetical protein